MEHGVDLARGILYLGADSEDPEIELTSQVAESVTRRILLLDGHHEWITIYMNNMGGDDIHGMAIYDALTTCTSKVRIIVMGHCHSIAALILQAAEDRVLAPHSEILIHDGEVIYSGSRKSARAHMEHDRQHTNRLNMILLRRIQERWPEYTLAKLERALEADIPMTAQEAVDTGLADRILRTRRGD
jgi:ATP-dependent Clp protease protease subunit